ncbi:MAG: DUF4446 family protein [Nitriliruptoraceae bacterium]
MPELDGSTTGVIAVAALALATVLLVVCVVLVIRFAALRATLRAVFPDGVGDVVAALDRQQHAMAELRDDIATVHANTEQLRDWFHRSLSRVGLVRYDAFSDVGGGQSFSVALLDRHGDGVVVSSINGRTESRVYGKDIVGGESSHTLSDEERAAVDAAIEGRPMVTLTPRRRRRSAS